MTEQTSRYGYGYRYGYRSLFWPIALIGVGVVWLLGNLGLIAPLNLYTLVQLWPLLLIAIGLDIIFGRRSALVGTIIGVGTLAVAIAILINAPALGIRNNAEIKSGHFTEPAGNAASAQIDLHLASGSTNVHSLSDSTALIDANLNYIGQVDFTAQGDQAKTVLLQQRTDNGFSWLFGLSGDRLRWDIGLSPKVPTDLRIEASSGSATFDLRDLKLKALTVDASSGSFNAQLPGTPEHYDLNLDASSGSMDFTVPDGAQFNSQIHMSSGSMTFAVPANAGVQVNVQNSSSGSVHVPSNYTHTVNNGRNRGTWESPNYGSAERRIVLTVVDMSSGSFEVR